MVELGPGSPAAIPAAGLSGDVLDIERTRWKLAIDAAKIGSFDWDLTTGELLWDDRLIELFGYERGSFDHTIEAFNARLHPDDLPRVTQALQHAIDTCGDYGAEYRVVRPDGSLRWIEARGRALCDESGRAVRVLGAAYDTTAVRDSESRVTRVLESMSAAFFLLDADWRFRYVNAEAERLLDRPRQELLGADIWKAFPAAVGTDFESSYRQAMQTGESVSFQAYYPEPLDAWYEVRAVPAPDGLSVYFVDVTAHLHALAQANRAARREMLVARVASELTQTLAADDAAAKLADVVVPALADWCVVSVVDDEAAGHPWDRLRDIASAHAEPDKQQVVHRYASVRRESLDEESFLARALRSGVPLYLDRDAAEALGEVLAAGEARDVLDQLAPAAVGVVPLVARGRTLGVLTVGHDANRLVSEADDRDILAELAARAGLALDNARLYEEQRRLAAGLQRSLLTEPPEPDHLHVVVRYEPAAEAAQVGGDWYDAFLQQAGTTMLVIGDVVGHDTAAAAAMGQLRGLLRGIAATTGESPSAVLTRLDAAMELLRVDTTATAVVARLEQTAQDREAGITRLRWSNAGHPAPMAIHPDGSVVMLSDPGESDLLLGIDPATPRSERSITLGRGATVFLYTDGLVERRGQSLDEGLAKLQSVLSTFSGRPVDELCDAVLEAMFDGEREDDVAIAAVRLYPQDQPRPLSAGPQRLPPSVD